jgi:hypothetical protein
MNSVLNYIIYLIGISFITAIGGLIYIHFFIKIPLLLQNDQKPSFWASFVSPFSQHKDFVKSLDLTTQNQDSYFQKVLKTEKLFIYLLGCSIIGFILLLVFMD